MVLDYIFLLNKTNMSEALFEIILPIFFKIFQTLENATYSVNHKLILIHIFQ